MDFIFLVLPAATTSFSGDGPPLTAEVCNRWAIKNSGKINLKWDKTKQLFQGLKVQSILVENFLKLGFKMVFFQSNILEEILLHVIHCTTNSSFLSLKRTAGEKMRRWGKWNKEKMVSPLLIFNPKSSVFIFFPQGPFFPLMDQTCNHKITLIHN